MKKEFPILVAGGAGFIGAHLCRSLLAQGHKILCIDNFISSREEGISDLLSNPDFTLLRHDIQRPIEKVNVSQIYNLACIASPGRYSTRPTETLKTNFLGTMNLLEVARANNCRILQASTSEIYGDPLVHPQCEKYNGNVDPTGPRSCYEEGKRVAEALIASYRQEHQCDARIGRLFNAYGPGMMRDDGRVVMNLINQALCGAPVSIYGDGMQTRSFCYVADSVEGLIALMNAERIETPVNLGHREEITILDLAKQIIAATGSSSEIVYFPPVPGEPRTRRPDIRNAAKYLNWEPKVSLLDGLAKTIATYR